MEDAMILNKSSFERGFAHASVYKSQVCQNSKYFNQLYMNICNIFSKSSITFDNVNCINGFNFDCIHICLSTIYRLLT